MLIQIILILFVIFALSRVALRHKNKDVRSEEALFWIIFWVIAGAVVLYPQPTVLAANFLGVGRGSDLVFYISIVALFYLAFRMLIRMEKMERNITQIVREAALKEKDKLKDKL